MDNAEKPKKTGLSIEKELALIEKREECGIMLEKLFRSEYTDPNFVKEVPVFLKTITSKSKANKADELLCNSCIKRGGEILRQKAKDRFDKQMKLKSLIFQDDISDIDSEFSQLLSTGATLDFTYEEEGIRNEGSLLLSITGYPCILNHVQYLHKKGAHINVSNSLGRTPLMVAAQNEGRGSDQVLKYFIKKGAMVNQKDVCGNTPLICLINSFVFAIKYDSLNDSYGKEYKEYLNKIDLLLRAGASLKICNQEGVNAFDLIKDCINMDDRYAKKFAKFVCEHEILSSFFTKKS